MAKKTNAKKANVKKKTSVKVVPPSPTTDLLDATQPVRPQNPDKGPPIDDATQRLLNHNKLPRRDPSGARGQRNDATSMTRKERTKR